LTEDVTATEPGHGDVVVVRASTAPEGRPESTPTRRYAVVQWGDFRLLSERFASLPKPEALFEARHCASERGRDAWDGAGEHLVRLPRLPLVYRQMAESFTVSVDATDYSRGGRTVAWKSTSNLSEAQALDELLGNGLPIDAAKGLLGKAPMPEACA
jgi:hypothetical protein